MNKTHSERIREGLQRAAAHGRTPGRRQKVGDADIRVVLRLNLSTVDGAAKVGLSVSQFINRRREIEADDNQPRRIDNAGT